MIQKTTSEVTPFYNFIKKAEYSKQQKDQEHDIIYCSINGSRILLDKYSPNIEHCTETLNLIVDN
jgi:hypothetical protein